MKTRQLQILYISVLIEGLRVKFNMELAKRIEGLIEQIEDDFDLFKLRVAPGKLQA